MIKYEMTIVLGALALGPLSCSNQGTVDIGETAGGKLSDYAASWDGYAEAYQFDSGSDRIRITLDANGQGTLQVGDAPLLPPPTDPNIGYPPGAGEDGSEPPLLQAGFLYPIYFAQVESSRIQFTVESGDLYSLYCQLQTPVLFSDGPPPTYACFPNWETYSSPPSCGLINPDTQEQVPIDCGKFYTCHCPCTATSCGAPPLEQPDQGDVQLDAALESPGTEMVGTLVMGVQGERITVRLTRQ